MSYIFFTGAPGSKWSSIAKWIYWSPDINHSDYSYDREYWGPKSYCEFPMHTGAYWDPGMEFHIGEWDKPFTQDEGIKLIKSHNISTDLDFYKDHPIVMVLRDNQTCLDWWYEAGGFDITYPNYKPFYANFQTMRKRIKEQNAGIRKFIKENECTRIYNLIDLNDTLGIEQPPPCNPLYPEECWNSYFDYKDVQVYVYLPTLREEQSEK